MDAEVWREFVRRFEPIIAGSVARVAWQYHRSSPDLVRDLTQDVYFKLCREEFKLLKDLRLTHEKALFAYLKLVAMSVAHDYFRRRYPEDDAGECLDDALSDIAPGCGAAVLTAEEQVLRREIEEIVEKITIGPHADRDRAVFWLHYREGFAASEIAAIPGLELTQKGVESVLHRIRTSLRSEIMSMRKQEKLRQRVKPGFSVS